MINGMRTILGLTWSLISCLTALMFAMMSKRFIPFVLTRIGSQMWSSNMLRIAGINRPYVTFAFDEAQFERWPEKVIIVSNHASQLDINVCASVIPRPIVYLAKASIRKVPVLGLLNERVGTVFIDRSNKSAAKKSIDNLLDSLSKGISVIVYPEGTRSVDGELNPFKKGAFYLAAGADVPVIPMHVHGTRKVLPKGGWLLRPNPVHVRFGSPIHPESASTADITKLSKAAFESVSAMRKWHQENVASPD
jgi:1-acyl-sn-glycerol-3-phosphate acyltransferase